MAGERPRVRQAVALVAVLFSVLAMVAGCGSSSQHRSGDVVHVVAAENFWGSIVSQIGGANVVVSNIIDNPQTDPHDYEPTPADARLFATADLIVVNGAGYDQWAQRLLAATTHQHVLSVADLVGAKDGDNPHLWYSPADVRAFIGAVTAQLQRIEPTRAAAFANGRATFENSGLKEYDALITQIKQHYAGTPVGASESIFAMLAPALGLDLITPPRFLAAISEGSDVTAGDKATIDRQIAEHRIRIYVYNAQNATPDIQEQLRACEKAGIPTATITETPEPASANFQQWQVKQLRGILTALQKAGGQ